MPITIKPDAPRVSNCCPICDKPVDENNRLTARYYPPRDWWVICHERRQSADDSWSDYCQQAMYQLVFNP